MSRAKTQSTPSSEKYKVIFLCALGAPSTLLRTCLAGEAFLKFILSNILNLDSFLAYILVADRTLKHRVELLEPDWRIGVKHREVRTPKVFGELSCNAMTVLLS
jgi:hypothetical protein